MIRRLLVLLAGTGLALLPTAALADGPGDYVVQPIRCPTSITYTVNVDSLDPAHQAEVVGLVRLAADITQEHLGQQMVYVGRTHYGLTVASYAQAPAMVEVDVVAPALTDFYGPTAFTIPGGYTRWDGLGHQAVAVNPWSVYSLPPVVGSTGPSLLALIEHELMHAVGVHGDHSSDPGDIFYWQLNAQTPWSYSGHDQDMLKALPCVTSEGVTP